MSRANPQGLLLHPKYWPVWLGFGVLRLLALLPYPILMAAGRGIGHLSYHFVKRRVKVARINIGLCFPELSETEQAKLVKQYFIETGMGIASLTMAWWWPEERITPWFDIKGLEHIEKALEAGKGIIFMTGHFASLEISGYILSRFTEAYAMYRPHENPVAERVIATKRKGFMKSVIPREDVRMMLRSLKNNKGVWFAPDQNYGLKNSTFVDFFGIAAASNTSASRFVEMTGASVLPFVALRRPNGGYEVTIEPTLENFAKDPKVDTQCINHIIERWARKAPAQYNWMHRRFKDRPNNEARFY